MENSRKVKARWRKKKPSPEAKKTNAQIRRAWKTGKRRPPAECVERHGETTCKGCEIDGYCRWQNNAIQAIRRRNK